MRRLWIYSVLAVVLLAAVSVSMTENAIRIPPDFRVTPDPATAQSLATQSGSTWSEVQVNGAGGMVLRAWLFHPVQANGSAVLLLHGIADTRRGVTGHAAYLLKAGYICLLPDSRGHGNSDGEFITYGVQEAGDVSAWAGFLTNRFPGVRLYGLGESMGAAVLLESLPREPRIRAAVAECSFDEFSHVATDRLAQFTGLNAPWLFRPLVETGMLYARARYGLRLDQASPAAGLRHSRIPVLLIHGTRDSNIPPIHSRRLAAIRPETTQLWEVDGAEHVDSLGVEPDGLPRRVIHWFQK